MLEFLKKKKEPKNLKEILSQFNSLKEDFNKISEEFKEIKKDSNFSIQKVGMVRFNPFKETGGNQSFSIALLNNENDGVVITSIYGREGNRVFAKPVKKCKSKYLLSEEEKKAIKQAESSKIKNNENEK